MIMATPTWIGVTGIVLGMVAFALQPDTICRKQTVLGVVGLVLFVGGGILLLVGLGIHGGWRLETVSHASVIEG